MLTSRSCGFESDLEVKLSQILCAFAQLWRSSSHLDFVYLSGSYALFIYFLLRWFNALPFEVAGKDPRETVIEHAP